jgi:hypothetical protein
VEPVGQESPSAEPLRPEPLGREPLGAEPLGREPLGAEPLGAEPRSPESLSTESLSPEPLSVEQRNADRRSAEQRYAALVGRLAAAAAELAGAQTKVHEWYATQQAAAANAVARVEQQTDQAGAALAEANAAVNFTDNEVARLWQILGTRLRLRDPRRLGPPPGPSTLDPPTPADPARSGSAGSHSADPGTDSATKSEPARTGAPASAADKGPRAIGAGPTGTPEHPARLLDHARELLDRVQPARHQRRRPATAVLLLLLALVVGAGLLAALVLH